MGTASDVVKERDSWLCYRVQLNGAASDVVKERDSWVCYRVQLNGDCFTGGSGETNTDIMIQDS